MRHSTQRASAPAAAAVDVPAEVPGHVVKSPMVGTSIALPPWFAAFVEVGASVKDGDTL